MACEALLRWPHADRGLISAAEFIPVAEEMGLIVEIGNRALRRACQECRRWPGDTAVAVNFSSIQFEHSDVPAPRPRSRRRGCVTEYGGPARRYGDIVEAHGQRGRYAFSELFRRDQAEGTPDVASSNLRLRPTSERTRGSL